MSDEMKKLIAENKKMRKALETIIEWRLPMLDDGEWHFVPYTVMRGSNGERDYMRQIAQNSLGE